MQGREHEVPGLGRGQRGRHRLEVAHLADEDDVGVLPQHRLERPVERLGVGAHLALVDHALLVAVQELDRVFDGHDVLFARLVDLVDHRGQGGGLARAGRPGDEDEAARLLVRIVQRLGKTQLFELLDVDRDEAEGGAQAVALEVGVDPEARPAGDRVREVDLPFVLQPLPLVLREDAVDQLAGVVGAEPRVVEPLAARR